MDYTSIFTLMRAEVTLTAILVFVFLYDLMAGERARRRFSAVVCCLMVVQVVVNLVPAAGGELFGGMFCHTPMDGIVKSMLSVGALIVFLQSDTWLRREDTRHKQGEFYILTLSTLLGMYFMIGAGNFLLFFIGQIQLWFAVFDVIIGEIAHQTTGEGRHVVHHRAFILLDDFPDSVTWMSNLHDRF